MRKLHNDGRMIDLAFVFADGQVPDGKGHLSLIGTVTGALHEEDVSVTLLQSSPLALRFSVLSKGRPLFVYDEIALTDFVEETIDRYIDFAVDDEPLLRDYDRALVEEYARAAG